MPAKLCRITAPGGTMTRRFMATILLCAGMVLPSRTSGQQRATDGVVINDEGLPQYSTFSLCAIDPATGQSGASVTTRVPFVGRAVPHVRAGVGFVCTQASTVVEYGPRGLDLLAKGVEPQTVLTELLAGDQARETRQVGLIDMRGRAVAHTGKQNGNWAGSRQGPNYTVQANIMVGPQVVDAVAAQRSEEHTSELQSRRDLVCRLLLEKKKKHKTLYLNLQNKQNTFVHI